ncbi:MAG: agmatine deiminase family protein [Planctomycetota bacterium]
MPSKSGRFALALLLLLSSQPILFAQKSLQDEQPLTRVREGGTPYDPDQPLHPYAVQVARAEGTTGSVIASPPEYAPVHGVLYKFGTGWDDIVTAMVAELTRDPAHDEIAYVVVPNVSERNFATTMFTNAGADMNKVEFMIHPGESIWMRDYGPHFVWIDGTLTIADSHYYPGRPLDNFIPTRVGDADFNQFTEDIGLYYSGGNFQPGPGRSGFVTALVNLDNPASEGFSPASIAELYQQYQGVDTLHVLPQLPFSVDGTGHIDMWMYLIDEDTCIISEFVPGSNSTAINVTNNAVPYMESLGYTVHRPPAWNSGSTHYTYANAYRVNDRIFVPVYGTNFAPGGNSSYNDEDAAAMAVWQAAAGPGIEIVPIQCINIIWASGAIHCIVKQVPRYTETTPACSILSPTAGETWIGGELEPIRWTTTDTNNAEVDFVELYYSIDGGDSWNFIDQYGGNVFEYVWQVPMDFSADSLIRIVATGTDGDATIATSESFSVGPGTETVYDFASSAGTDRKVFGTNTTSWSQIDGNSMPVNSEIGSTNYGRLATSNASGNDNDANRYIAPYPGSSGETTHLFEFTLAEDEHSIDEMVFSWEGYSDNCTQCELYVWDIDAQQWGDGTGLTGQNSFMDSWAGNEDGILTGIIKGNACNYVDANGRVRFLIYGERDRDESFHDYARLTVKQADGTFDRVEVVQGNGTGVETDLFTSDNTDYSISRDPMQIQAVVSFEVEGSGNCENPGTLELTLESSVFSRPAVAQEIRLWNFNTGQYELIDSRAASRFGDQVSVASASGNLSRFVESGTGLIRAKIDYRAASNRAAFSANVDQVELAID